MKTFLAVSLVLLSGCLFPTAVDPCPTPPEQHPEAWQPITTREGIVLGYACMSQ